MEFAKAEVAAVEQVADQSRVEVKELNDLELVMVGGGCGEVVFG